MAKKTAVKKNVKKSPSELDEVMKLIIHSKPGFKPKKTVEQILHELRYGS